MRTAEVAYNQTVEMLDVSVDFVLKRLDDLIAGRIKEGAFFYEMKLSKETIEPQSTIILNKFLQKMTDLGYKVEGTSEGKSYIISWNKTTKL